MTTQRVPPRIAFVISSTLVVLGAGCDEPASKHPTGPSSSGIAAVEISGPATLAPGQSAQFTAVLRLADGSLKAGTPGVIERWRIGNSSLLQVTETGMVTAQATMGDTTLSVEMRIGTETRTATREIVVLPDGTHRLVGRISEKDSRHGVAGARVEVVHGTVSTTSDSNGDYRLYGVPTSAVIRVSATGYLDIEHTVSLSGYAKRDFQMGWSGLGPTVQGPYTLAITAVCPPGHMSPALQHRRYDAFVSQNGSTVEVELTEPRFRVGSLGRGNRFTGRVTGSGVVFTLRDYGAYFYGYLDSETSPDLMERLADDSFLAINGDATTSLSGSMLSGLLRGLLINWDSRFPNLSARLGACYSTSHKFVLMPR